MAEKVVLIVIQILVVRYDFELFISLCPDELAEDINREMLSFIKIISFLNTY